MDKNPKDASGRRQNTDVWSQSYFKALGGGKVYERLDQLRAMVDDSDLGFDYYSTGIHRKTIKEVTVSHRFPFYPDEYFDLDQLDLNGDGYIDTAEVDALRARFESEFPREPVFAIAADLARIKAAVDRSRGGALSGDDLTQITGSLQKRYPGSKLTNNSVFFNFERYMVGDHPSLITPASFNLRGHRFPQVDGVQEYQDCFKSLQFPDEIFRGYDMVEREAAASDLARAMAAFLRKTVRPFVPDSAVVAVDNYREELDRLSQDKAVAFKQFTQEGLFPKAFKIPMQQWPGTGTMHFGIGIKMHQFEPFPLNACEFIGMHNVGDFGVPTGPREFKNWQERYTKDFSMLNRLYVDPSKDGNEITADQVKYAVPLIDPIKGTKYTGFAVKRPGQPIVFLTTRSPE